jgi:prevent-host-death family protein
MAHWQLQQAKSRLSEVIEEAHTVGPQIITRHGVERAVIMSIGDYRALTAHITNMYATAYGLMWLTIQTTFLLLFLA